MHIPELSCNMLYEKEVGLSGAIAQSGAIWESKDDPRIFSNIKGILKDIMGHMKKPQGSAWRHPNLSIKIL